MKITLFGATGLVGNSFLSSSLKCTRVNEIVCPVRSTFDINSSKIKILLGLKNGKISDFQNEMSESTACVCAIGSTLKQAGTREGFYRIDHDLVLEIAKTSLNARIPHFLFVSAIGARLDSSNFYLKTKGEVENALIQLQFPRLTIVRPSLLLGNRTEFRLGEMLARKVMPVFNSLLIGGLRPYRGIHADTVAQALLSSVLVKDSKTVEILNYDSLHERAAMTSF